MKHKYLTEGEWDDIKRMLEAGRKTHREIAFQVDKGDYTVQRVNQTESFREYQEKYQTRCLPKQEKMGRFIFETATESHYWGNKQMLDNQQIILNELRLIRSDLALIIKLLKGGE